MFHKILSFVIFLLVAFSTYLVIKTISFKSKQLSYPKIDQIDIKTSAIEHLAEAVTIRTISPAEIADYDSAQFTKFIEFLSNTYPLTEELLSKAIINEFSILYKWRGKDRNKKPAILTAHLDVVPVAEEALPAWKAPPFSGFVRHDTIWGRGTLDDKVGVIGIMEAVEHLLAEDFLPERTIFLAFGHDEELGGRNGALEIVKALKDQQVQPEFVLDEGYTITQGLVPGVLTDAAIIGIAEKGSATINLSVVLEGGHSSMPGRENAILSISRAISGIADKPFPAEISEPVHLFLDHVGPEMRFQDKLVFANRAIFESVILDAYQQSAAGRAVVQTTMAPTIFNSGVKENVIPSTASASINFRMLPGTSTDDLLKHVKQVIGDEKINVELSNFYSEPSSVSSINAQGYFVINKTIREVFPEAITAPNLSVAATDGRYYHELCDHVYRFLPVRLNPDNVNAMHGINEHIPAEDFKNAVRFYIQLIKNCQ